jgi:hypothetical protein
MGPRRKGKGRERVRARRLDGAIQRKQPCQICRLILHAFKESSITNSTEKSKGKVTELGTVRDVLSVDCRVHRSLLLMALPWLSRYSAAGDVIFWDDDAKEYIRVRNQGNYTIEIQIGYRLSFSLVLSGRNQNVVYRSLGRSVDPEWINLRHVQNWISICDQQHGKNCRRTYNWTKIAQHRPNLVIDSWRKCLTKITSEAS